MHRFGDRGQAPDIARPPALLDTSGRCRDGRVGTFGFGKSGGGPGQPHKQEKATVCGNPINNRRRRCGNPPWHGAAASGSGLGRVGSDGRRAARGNPIDGVVVMVTRRASHVWTLDFSRGQALGGCTRHCRQQEAIDEQKEWGHEGTLGRVAHRPMPGVKRALVRTDGSARQSGMGLDRSILIVITHSLLGSSRCLVPVRAAS